MTKTSKHFARNVEISATSGDFTTARVKIGNGPSMPYSDKALQYVTDQMHVEQEISGFAQWSLTGDVDKVKECFSRTMPDNKKKTVRLHHTASPYRGSIDKTITDLLNIGLYRSAKDPGSRTKFSSPMHLLSDGVFHLGYDMILIPTESGLHAIVNPTVNYHKWIDIAIVGVFHGANEMTLMFDKLLKEMVFKYGQHLMVCDHHSWDPSAFGVNTTSPFPVADLKNPLAYVASTISDFLKEIPGIGDLAWIQEQSARSTVQFSSVSQMAPYKEEISRPSSAKGNRSGAGSNPVKSSMDYLSALARDLDSKIS